MIYLILNIVVAFFLGIFTHLIDKKVKSESVGVSAFSIGALLALIESILFSLVLIMKLTNFEPLITPVMRFVLSIDGIIFVIVSFGFIEVNTKRRPAFVKLLKVFLIAFAIYISFFKYNTIDITFENGIVIGSPYLFPVGPREYFSWQWGTLYSYLYKVIIPIFAMLFLLIIQENTATQLEKYQTAVVLEGLFLFWIIKTLIEYVSKFDPAFSFLFIYEYMFLFVIIYSALTKTSVPSGKALFVMFLKTILTYLIPATGIGAICYFLQPEGNNFTAGFISMFTISGIAIVVISLAVSRLLTSSSKLYTADYEDALEKDLAKVEYSNAEMDQVTAKMFEVLRRNVETSSMTVYILTGQNELEVAYSSNNMNNKIPLNNPMFDALLNINKSIVCFPQIEKEHDLSVCKPELEEFFKTTKSDALFLLNEGHNIFGIITLGKKVSGDHFKEYDYNVFVKLYSYFFVFGYYMRNISNKDIIGVVNREIRMSSQIITSIQENIDHPKTTKVDIGYLMVPAHNIGGEFIDMIRLTDTRHLFVVGDLSGRGIAASMNMVILKSIIRTYLGETHDFKQLVVKLNNFVRDSLPKGTIFAGLFALIDFETDTMYYINCGVPTLMLYTQVYNNVIEIQGSGHILGFVKDISPYLSVKTTKLNRGDIIMACTDGVIQSHSLRGEIFGKERLQQAVLDNSTYPAQRMTQFTFDGLLKFMSKEAEEDVSMLVLKYEGIPVEEDEVTEEKTEDAVVEENAAEEAVAEVTESTVEETVIETPIEDSPIEAVADEVIEPENPPVEEEKIEEAPKPAEETSAGGFGDMDLPEGFEMPDLGDLDAMLKEAGL